MTFDRPSHLEFGGAFLFTLLDFLGAQQRAQLEFASIKITGTGTNKEGKSRNRRTFLKIENLRFLQNYDDYNCVFGIKLKGLSLSFI